MIPKVIVTLREENFINNCPKYIFGCEEAAPIFINQISDYAVEVISLICINTQNELLNFSIVSYGKVNKVSVDYATLLKTILLSNAKYIIIGHNHPSNKLIPSQSDLDATRNIAKICKLLDVDLIDSIILTPNKKWISIRSFISSKGVDYSE